MVKNYEVFDLFLYFNFVYDRVVFNFRFGNLETNSWSSVSSEKKFDNRVSEYDWVDHHAPPLKILFEICREIMLFLNSMFYSLARKFRKYSRY